MSFFCLPYGNRKAVKKMCQWHIFRPWEIPLTSGRIPPGMWTEVSLLQAVRDSKDRTGHSNTL